VQCLPRTPHITLAKYHTGVNILPSSQWRVGSPAFLSVGEGGIGVTIDNGHGTVVFGAASNNISISATTNTCTSPSSSSPAPSVSETRTHSLINSLCANVWWASADAVYYPNREICCYNTAGAYNLVWSIGNVFTCTLPLTYAHAHAPHIKV
jgi:hypothetical protein